MTEDRAGHLGIVELRDICERLAARHEDLFRMLGGWVADTPDPSAQQLFAEACHRHAWHAELWRARSPAIPINATHSSAHGPADGGLDPAVADRVAAYRSALDDLLGVTEHVAGRADPVVDPGTQRVGALTLADLTDLARRADAVS